jgi:hypothetical protein
LYGYNTPDDSLLLRHAVREAIDCFIPPLAKGPVGPDYCILSGYDLDVEVICGHSFHQADAACQAELEFDPTGYFMVKDWEPRTSRLICVWPKRRTPPEAPPFRQALTLALAQLERSLVLSRVWTARLLDDSSHAAPDGPGLARTCQVYRSAARALAERRLYAWIFLRMSAYQEPRLLKYSFAQNMILAHSAYERLMLLLEQGAAPLERGRLAEPGFRRDAAGLLEAAIAQESEAAKLAALALETWR